jgi:hypothetical protein
MEIYKGGTQNNKNKPRGSPAIKNYTKNQYNKVFVFFISQIIAQQKKWQKGD